MMIPAGRRAAAFGVRRRPAQQLVSLGAALLATDPPYGLVLVVGAPALLALVGVIALWVKRRDRAPSSRDEKRS